MNDFHIIVTLQGGESRQTSLSRLIEVFGMEESSGWEANEGGWRAYLLARFLKIHFAEVRVVRVYDPSERQIHAIF